MCIRDRFDIPLQGDDFDDIREEYTQMLKKQAAKGNNGIIKSKYLIFGIESKGFKEARSKLTNIEADVIKNFTNLGTYAKSLDGKERLRILHELSLIHIYGWQDSEGRTYIVYPIAEIAEMLDKGCTTIKGALNELDAAGLLERLSLIHIWF